MSSNSITTPKQAPQSMALNFILGGASGCTATLFIQPLDMVKVRIQLLSELGRKNVGFLTVGKELVAENGFKYLFSS